MSPDAEAGVARGPEPERLVIGADMPALRWTASQDAPTIVTFHGGGHSKDIVGTRTVARALDAGVSLVAADLYLHGEHMDEYAATLGHGDEVLAEIVSHTAKDLCSGVAELGPRVGLRGESLGGRVVLAALADGARVHAAVALGAGGVERTPSVPLLLVYGMQDEVVPFTGAPPGVELVAHPGGHETPARLDADAWAWLFARLRR